MKNTVGVKSVVRVGMAALILAAVGPASAFADWTGPQTVHAVYAGYAGGEIYIRMSNTGCSANVMRMTTDTEKVLSIATTALLTGKKLDCFAVPPCESSGYVPGNRCVLNN